MKLPAFIREDWPRKVVALVFAVIVWVVITQHISVERSFRSVQLNIKPPQNLERIGELPALSVTVRGTQNEVSSMGAQDILVEPKLSEDLEAGTHSISLQPREVSTNRSVRVVSVKPDRVSVTLDNIVDKTVRVNESLRHLFEEIPERYGIHTIDIRPEEIVVTGPSTYIKPIQRVAIDKQIRLGDNPGTKLNFNCPLRTIPNVSFSHSTVNVELLLYVKHSKRLFNDLPVHILTPVADGMQAELEVATIESLTVRGPGKVLDVLGRDSFKLFVDIGDQPRPGTYLRQVKYWLTAKNCDVEKIVPANLPVKLTPIEDGEQ